MGKKQEGEFHQRLVRVMAHPLRVQILRILGEQTASPNQLAAITGEPLGTVSYHVRVLVDSDCLVLEETKQRRGAVESFYRAKPAASIESQIWPEIPPALRGELVAESLRELTQKVIAALEDETFQRREGSGVSWLTMRVDAAGWNEVRKIVGAAEQSLREVGERCIMRLHDDPGIPVVVALTAFETTGRHEPQ